MTTLRTKMKTVRMMLEEKSLADKVGAEVVFFHEGKEYAGRIVKATSMSMSLVRFRGSVPVDGRPMAELVLDDDSLWVARSPRSAQPAPAGGHSEKEGTPHEKGGDPEIHSDLAASGQTARCKHCLQDIPIPDNYVGKTDRDGSDLSTVWTLRDHRYKCGAAPKVKRRRSGETWEAASGVLERLQNCVQELKALGMKVEVSITID